MVEPTYVVDMEKPNRVVARGDVEKRERVVKKSFPFISFCPFRNGHLFVHLPSGVNKRNKKREEEEISESEKSDGKCDGIYGRLYLCLNNRPV